MQRVTMLGVLRVALSLFTLTFSAWPSHSEHRAEHIECAGTVAVVLWQPSNGTECDSTCEVKERQWNDAKELFSPAVKFMMLQHHNHGAVASAYINELPSHEKREISLSKVVLTLHYTIEREKHALVVPVSRGAEVSLSLNSLCQNSVCENSFCQSKPKFPRGVLNAINIIQKITPKNEALSLVHSGQANLDAWNPISDQNSAPLLAAANDKNIEMLTWLLEVGANHQQVNHHGDTALILAVRDSNHRAPQSLDMVTALLEAGANLTVCNKLGETPLHALLQEW